MNQTTTRTMFCCAATLCGMVLCAAPLSAATLLPLESRLNGQAYYDPNLDITWARDADLLGESTLVAAKAALGNLVIAGVSGWRLPIADRNDDGTAVGCKGATLDACLDNELGFMLNIRQVSAAAPGPFTELRADWYWSASDNPANQPRVFAWLMNSADQEGFGDAHPENIGLRTWAVIDGDVSAVPLPAAAWLFIPALGVVAGLGRRPQAPVSGA